jgi:hypothetical protein
MATYYVSNSGGSDSNNGLGPDASDATNKPWLTIGKALGASGISSGDTVGSDDLGHGGDIRARRPGERAGVQGWIGESADGGGGAMDGVYDE